jgi:hypothetical protein
VMVTIDVENENLPEIITITRLLKGSIDLWLKPRLLVVTDRFVRHFSFWFCLPLTPS